MDLRVRPIPGMSRYTDTDTGYLYLYKKNLYLYLYEAIYKNWYLYWYGGYGGYRYQFGIEDMDMGDIGISVIYRFFNIISVSYIYISVSYRYIGIIPIYCYPYPYRYGSISKNRYRFGKSPYR